MCAPSSTRRGVTPDTLKSLDDIRRFPFTTKADMRDTYPFGLFAVPREQVVRLHASSGTTGKATVVGYTQGDIDLWTDLMARCIACAGARPGDIVHNAYGYGLFTGGLGAHYGAERLGCTVVPVSGGMTERQVTLLQDFGAHVLCATPSYALNIAEVAEGMGVDIRKLPLRRYFRRRALERGHAPRPRRRSSASRRSISTACRRSSVRAWPASAAWRAMACTAGRITSCSRSSIPRRSSRCARARPGELVITTLTKQALPMVRYRSRDITRLTRRALRLRPHPCAHHARDRPRRRHDDHSRRQCLSVAGRGGAGRLARASRRTIRSC